ncbi:VOC family protein [Streptomyces sp. NPDC060184]|uniref:VOC family protein n=1 Tax=Streptomyces sp. NPDC060184 TaxID=3347064 RepID=UPI00366A1ABB
MPLARLAAINLECSDPVSLARFWAHLLGGEVAVETPGFCAVRAGTLHLGAVRVADYRQPTWPSGECPQQMHLDLTVEDLDTAEHEAVRLGATKERLQPAPERSRVLRDPAGHPFCLRS